MSEALCAGVKLMRRSFCSMLAAFLIMPALGQTVQSQAGSANRGKPRPPVTRVPYTATYQETRVRTLPDGKTSTEVETVVETRDSQGRRRSMRLLTLPPHPWAKSTATLVTVEDAETRTQWITLPPGDERKGQATVWHYGAPCPKVTPPPTPAEQAKPTEPPLDEHARQVHEALEDVRARNREKFPLSKSVTENLGVKTIKGIEVRGYRITTTTYIGGSPSVNISETWHDTTPGLFIQVLVTDEGPERKYRRELMSITLGEPDPTIFRPPADFEIVDEKPPDCPATGATATTPESHRD